MHAAVTGAPLTRALTCAPLTSQAALDHLSARGALVVASAGNDGMDTDTTPHYPSSLPDDIILAVGASTRQNALWWATSSVTPQTCIPRVDDEVIVTSDDLHAWGTGLRCTDICPACGCARPRETVQGDFDAGAKGLTMCPVPQQTCA